MSTPYRSPGCARCGAELPPGAAFREGAYVRQASSAPRPPGGPDGGPVQGSPLCERCVLEAITDARRLLERLGADPAPAPAGGSGRRMTDLVAMCVVLVFGAAGAAFVVGSAIGADRQWIRSRAALTQTQTASAGTLAEDPRAPSRTAVTRGPPAGSLAARAQGDRRSADPRPPFPRATGALPWPPAILATAEKSVTHDPQELFARAERLAVKGADLTLRETRLSSASLPLGGSTGLHPIFREGQPLGVKVSRPGPLLEGAGLESGDLVTAVNGYAYPEDPRRWVEPFLQPSGNAVIEVLRGARRVVLSVRWREPLVK